MGTGETAAAGIPAMPAKGATNAAPRGNPAIGPALPGYRLRAPPVPVITNPIPCNRGTVSLTSRTAYSRAWRKANPQKCRGYTLKWRAANQARIRATSIKWIKRNPTRIRAHQAKIRAKRRAALCECCPPNLFHFIYGFAKLTGAQVDHRIPLAVGGKHCGHNLQLLTPSQHREKTRVDVS